jgi:hypothetical protein
MIFFHLYKVFLKITQEGLKRNGVNSVFFLQKSCTSPQSLLYQRGTSLDDTVNSRTLRLNLASQLWHHPSIIIS